MMTLTLTLVANSIHFVFKGLGCQERGKLASIDGAGCGLAPSQVAVGRSVSSKLLKILRIEFATSINVGLTGAFLCAQVFGTHMAANGGGVILNIASDL